MLSKSSSLKKLIIDMSIIFPDFLEMNVNHLHTTLNANKSIGKNLVELVCLNLENLIKPPLNLVEYMRADGTKQEGLFSNYKFAFEEQLLILNLLNPNILRKLKLTTRINAKDLQNSIKSDDYQIESIKSATEMIANVDA